MPKALLAVDECKAFLADPQWIFLDASLEKAIGAVPPLIEGQYLPRSRRFDYDQIICDRNSLYPHTMPSAEDFSLQVRRLGINNTSNILVYDRRGVYASPRAWWMFKIMGCENVWVLDGGLPAWIAAGLPVVNELEPNIAEGDFVASLRKDRLVDRFQVQQSLKRQSVKIIDARSKGRFCGLEPEPRAGLRGGHMPGALNLPFTDLCEGSQFVEEHKYQKITASLVADKNKELYFSCGSGVTACIDLLAFYQCDYPHLALYDGSWSEWAALKDTEIEI